jgi:hypothetical protein
LKAHIFRVMNVKSDWFSFFPQFSALDAAAARALLALRTCPRPKV